MKSTQLKRIAARVRELVPYVLTGLLVPGGSIVALALWLHQRRHKEI